MMFRSPVEVIPGHLTSENHQDFRCLLSVPFLYVQNETFLSCVAAVLAQRPQGPMGPEKQCLQQEKEFSS